MTATTRTLREGRRIPVALLPVRAFRITFGSAMAACPSSETSLIGA
jgi:hypothetical protein